MFASISFYPYLFHKQFFITYGKDFGECFQFDIGDKSGAALDALNCVFIQFNSLKLHLIG